MYINDDGQLGAREKTEKSLAAQFRLPEDLLERMNIQQGLAPRFPVAALFSRAVMAYIQENGYLDNLLGTAQSYLQLKVRQFLQQVVGIESMKTFRMTPAEFYGAVSPHLKAFQFVLRDAFHHLETVMDHNERTQQTMRLLDELQTKHGEVEAEREAFRTRIEELSVDAATDPLTGLQNRKTMDAKIEKIAREHPDEPYVFMIFDMDKFKRVNDDYGHHAGDEAIKQLAGLIATRAGIRYEDIVRLGGEEFVVLFHNTDGRGLSVANLIRKLVEDFEFVVTDNKSKNHRLKKTASVGVAFCQGRDLADGVAYKKADHALQLAKGKRFTSADILLEEEDPDGRNRVWVYGRLMPEDRDTLEVFEPTTQSK